MGDKPTAAAQEREAARKRRPTAGAWRWAPFLAVGIACGAASVYISYKVELGQKLYLDFKGVRTEGTAESMGEGVWSIRYTHPSGAIHRRRYIGGFGFQRHDTPAVTIVYNEQRPENFQPRGVSYLPGAASGALFLVAMACVFHARRITIRSYRQRAGPPEPAKSGKLSRRKRKHTRDAPR